MVIIFLTKQSFSIEFKEALGSQKWIAKVDTDKQKWMKKAFLSLLLVPLENIMSR